MPRPSAHLWFRLQPGGPCPITCRLPSPGICSTPGSVPQKLAQPRHQADQKRGLGVPPWAALALRGQAVGGQCPGLPSFHGRAGTCSAGFPGRPQALRLVSHVGSSSTTCLPAAFIFPAPHSGLAPGAPEIDHCTHSLVFKTGFKGTQTETGGAGVRVLWK